MYVFGLLLSTEKSNHFEISLENFNRVSDLFDLLCDDLYLMKGEDNYYIVQRGVIFDKIALTYMKLERYQESIDYFIYAIHIYTKLFQSDS